MEDDYKAGISLYASFTKYIKQNPNWKNIGYDKLYSEMIGLGHYAVMTKYPLVTSLLLGYGDFRVGAYRRYLNRKKRDVSVYSLEIDSYYLMYLEEEYNPGKSTKYYENFRKEQYEKLLKEQSSLMKNLIDSKEKVEQEKKENAKALLLDICKSATDPNRMKIIQDYLNNLDKTSSDIPKNTLTA